MHWACVPRNRIPKDGHCLGGDLTQLGKLLVHFAGDVLRELIDGPIDLRLVAELVEVPGDWKIFEIPLDDKFFFYVKTQRVLFGIILGTRRL